MGALNLSRGYRRSGLTKQQKKEAEAAIYGIDFTQLNPTAGYGGFMEHTPMSSRPILTNDDIEKMRALVNQHDAMQQSFDINNPPKQVYKYQEYPKLMYREGPNGKEEHRRAHSKEEEAEAIENGWSTSPLGFAGADEPVLDEASANEAAEVQGQIDELNKKKSGRKPKQSE